MGTTTRVELPQEFMDLTSARMRLEPEPQYLHARLFFLATGASLGMSLGDLANPGRPSIGMGGAPYISPEAGRLMLSEVPAAAALEFEPAFGSLPGHTVRINRPIYTGNNHDEASREIKAGATISTNGQTIGSNQVTLTLKRYGGPHNGTEPAPYAVDRFDMNRGIHRASSIVGGHLKRDYDVTIDNFLVKLFDMAGSAVYPDGFAAVDDFAVAGDGPMTWAVMLKVEETLKNLHIPRFSNGKYIAILTPRQLRQLQLDKHFVGLSKEFPLYNSLFAGTYVTSAGGFDIFSSSTLTTTDNSSSVPVHRAQVFGPSAVGVGLAEMPRVARAIEDNYGETAKLIWLLYAAFGMLDDRFVVSARTS